MSRHKTPAFRLLATVFLAFTATGSAVPSAFAAKDACEGVKVKVTQSLKAEYGPLVAAALEGKIKAAQVEFDSIMQSGSWSAAYVSTPISDDGVMFFQTVGSKKHFRDVWGGWADPSERPELVAWAEKLGAPASLATCFAQTVAGDD